MIARRTVRSSDCGSATMVDHFVTGRAIPTRSPYICASIGTYLSPASPPMTTSGECPRLAWYSAPIELPSPGVLWIWTRAVLCRARANPSPIITATVSWSVST